MKKKLVTLLSCLFVASLGGAAFTACNKQPETPPQIEQPPADENESYEVAFNAAEGIEFSCGEKVTVNEGERFTFSVKVSVFYTGEPIVTTDLGETLQGREGEEEGTYTYTLYNVTENVKISVSGVEKAVSKLSTSGLGTMESPYLISKPIDLLEMAKQVNEGWAAYVLGYYRLANSIDLRGERLDVIGDGSTNVSFFAGFFDGDNHTISNFTIEAEDMDYVGLFGIVQGYDYYAFRGGVIQSLTIKDFVVSAKTESKTMICGSLVGQGLGATVRLCNAVNGTLDIYAERNHFSYAGGLIGMLRTYEYPYFASVSYSSADVDVRGRTGALYIAGGLVGYLNSVDDTTVSTVNNCYATGDVSGSFYAAGLIGWLGSYTSVANSYATGDVSAQSFITDLETSEIYCYAYAGGIAAMAQYESAISDSFAVGKLSAVAAAGKKYQVTGGISATSDEVPATAYGANGATVLNSYYAEGGKSAAIDLTDSAVLKSKLFWHDFDWLFGSSAYPVVNTEEPDDEDANAQYYAFNIVYDFGTVGVKGESETIYEMEVEIVNSYLPMSYLYLADIGVYKTFGGVDGHVSYGLYFDEAHTLSVPNGYMPTRDVKLYVAFADYKAVKGTYYIVPEGETESVCLVLKETGEYTCTDAYGSYKGAFSFDGKNVYFDSGRFARYSGVTTLERMQGLVFKAEVTADGDFSIWGGLYTDEEGTQNILIAQDSPITALKAGGNIVGTYSLADGDKTLLYTFRADGTGTLKTDGKASAFTYVLEGNDLTITSESGTVQGTKDALSLVIGGKTLSELDKFAGIWEAKSLSKKYYTFDGAGNWEYEYYGYEYDSASGTAYERLLESAKGKYEIVDGKAVLNAGSAPVYVTIENDGSMSVKSGESEWLYGKKNGYYGTWTSSNGSVKLQLSGLDKDGVGVAKITYKNYTESGKELNEIYDLTYTADVYADGNLFFFYDGEGYGALTYNVTSGTFSGQMYSMSADMMSSCTLYRLDEYEGEWIGDHSIFSIVNFNGKGSYAINGAISTEGTLTIDGQKVPYALDEFTLSGYFVYEGKVYDIVLDEAIGMIKISLGNDDVATLVQKDVLGGRTFVGDDDCTYEFDGRGALVSGGKMTLTNGDSETTYKYKLASDCVAKIYDENDSEIASIAIGEKENRPFYQFKRAERVITLGERTNFTGEWAVSASYGLLLEIGLFDLNGESAGKIPLTTTHEDWGETYETTTQEKTTFVLSEDGYVSCVVSNTTFYVIEQGKGEFIISTERNWFYSDAYSYALTSDDMVDEWSNTFNEQFRFDGLGYSKETYGLAYSEVAGGARTDYYYRWYTSKDGKKSGFILIEVNYHDAWLIVPCDPGTPRSYKNEKGDRAFKLESVKLADFTDEVE